MPVSPAGDRSFLKPRPIHITSILVIPPWRIKVKIQVLRWTERYAHMVPEREFLKGVIIRDLPEMPLT